METLAPREKREGQRELLQTFLTPIFQYVIYKPMWLLMTIKVFPTLSLTVANMFCHFLLAREAYQLWVNVRLFHAVESIVHMIGVNEK